MAESRPPRTTDPESLRSLLSEATLRCDHIDRRIMGPPWVPEPFRTLFDKLYVMFGGTGWVRLDDARWHIRPERVWLFPAGTVQQGHVEPDDPMDHLWVHFSAHTVKSLDLLRLAPPPRCVGGATARQITRLAVEIVEEWRSDKPTAPLAVTGLLTQCLVAAYRAPEDDVVAPDERVAADEAGASDVPPHQAEVLSDVIAWMSRSYADELTLPGLAERARMAPNYFSRLFKTYVGMPPMKFLESRRLRRAQEALAGTDLPVGEIAAAVGYSDPYYFSRAFRRFAGASPTAFRREALQASGEKSI